MAEKHSAHVMNQLLKQRLQHGDLERFRTILDKVPDDEPEEYDRL